MSRILSVVNLGASRFLPVNRGGKAILRTFQKAHPSADPKTREEFGDGLLMNQGYALKVDGMAVGCAGRHDADGYAHCHRGESRKRGELI